MSLDKKKNEMRATARVRRKEIAKAEGSIGESLAYDFSKWAARGLERGAIVSGYHPIADEADCLPVLAWLAEHGHRTCLPITQGRERPLIFREWYEGDALVSGGFGVQEPAEAALEVVPDILLIPLLAFDLYGGRLGYGAGHYDRTLAGLKAQEPLKIGIAYSAQRVEKVPMGKTDQPLDAILTENGLKWLMSEAEEASLA